MTPLRHVRIVGSGLIGTSIGLALRRADISVTMADQNMAAQSLAQDLMGPAMRELPVDLILIATPSHEVADVMESELSGQRIDEKSPKLSVTFMDVASIKAKPLLDISNFGLSTLNFLPSHPMAGREIGGAESARADLFEGCTWVYDPAGVEPLSIERGLELISLCGASALPMNSAEHDLAVALISHLPQLFATLLARQLDGANPAYLELSGAGLRDTTRIAASSPKLWSEIVSANAQAIRPLLEKVRRELDSLIDNLDEPGFLIDFIEGGNRGRAGIPGKHGGVSRSYTHLPVVIEDKPGQLAALFEECAAASVNIEDLAIEHSPEQFTGLITLALSSADASTLFDHLIKAGWKVHAPR